jgi:RHS repeat-associated protein
MFRRRTERRARPRGHGCWTARAWPKQCKLNGTPEPADSGRLHCVGTWLSLVEHSLGVRGVGSSNLPVPTIYSAYRAQPFSATGLAAAGPGNAPPAFTPFGEQYAASGTADPSFIGENSDTVSSLYDFPARRLSPSQGRWISPDPSGMAAVDPTNPQTWNRYAYVSNSPLENTDPTGLGPAGPCGYERTGPGGDIIMPAPWGTCGLGLADEDDGGCSLDGFATDCGAISDLVNAGAAGQCPNNNCGSMTSQWVLNWDGSWSTPLIYLGGGVYYTATIFLEESYSALLNFMANPGGGLPSSTPNAPNNPSSTQKPKSAADQCADQYSALANTAQQQANATAPSIRSTLAWMAGGAIAGASGGWLGAGLGALGGLIGNTGESLSYGVQSTYTNYVGTTGCYGIPAFTL